MSNQPISEVKGDKVQQLTKKEWNSLAGVRQYLITNKKPPYQKITKDIMWTDVLLNYSSQKDIPSLNVLANLYTVSQSLQTFVDKFYPGSKIVISSGWRSSSRLGTVRRRHRSDTPPYIKAPARRWR